MTVSPLPIPYVFVSHSSGDHEFCAKLVNDLRHELENETTVWYDAELRGGDAWWRKVVEQLTVCKVFIVVLSPDAISSGWVKDEITIALARQELTIIPLLYRPCKILDEFENLQYISFLPSRSYKEAFAELSSLLLAVRLNKQQKALPMFYLSRRTTLISVITALGAVGGSTIILQLLPWIRHTPAPISFITKTFYHLPPQGEMPLILSVVWSPDGKYIASADGETVQIWDVNIGRKIFSFNDAHGGSGDSIGGIIAVWSPESSYIAFASYQDVQVWDTKNRKGAFRCSHHSAITPKEGVVDSVSAIVWSPDGSHIAYGFSSGLSFSQVQVWNGRTGRFLNEYESYWVDAMAWSPSNKYIAGSSGGTVCRWDALTGDHVFIYSGHSDMTNGIAWSPDSVRIASASDDGTVQVWNATTGVRTLTYRGHRDVVYAVAWSPNGKRIASASQDKTVQVWDAFTGNNVFMYMGHVTGVDAVAWSPDGQHIVSGSQDGIIKVWKAE